MPKKIVPYEVMTKPILIALVKKLQNRVAKLEKQLNDIAVGNVDPYDVVRVTQEHTDEYLAGIQAKTAFPWDAK